MDIVKFIFALQFGFTAPQQRHLLAFVHGIILYNGRKTVTQVGRAGGTNRQLSFTTRFLNESPWSVSRLQQRRLALLLTQNPQNEVQARRVSSH